jgi:hypothetical protein
MIGAMLDDGLIIVTIQYAQKNTNLQKIIFMYFKCLVKGII